MAVLTQEAYKALWDEYLVKGGDPPVYPEQKHGVASAVHNRRLKAIEAKTKRTEKGARIKIRKHRL